MGAPASRAQAPADIRYSTVVSRDGLPLAVKACGAADRPALLLIHGFSLSYASFDGQFTPANCARWRMVAFDLRGHGRSGKPWTAASFAPSALWGDDVAAVMQATALRRPVIVGWSYGGYVALDYVRRHGTANVAALNLVGSTAGLVERRPPQAEAADDHAELARLNATGTDADAIRAAALFVSLMNAKPLPAAQAEAMRASILMLPPYVRGLMRERSLDNRDLVARIDRPLLFSIGDKDLSIARESVDMLSRLRPHFRLSRHPDAGHMVHADAPERFERELEALLAVP